MAKLDLDFNSLELIFDFDFSRQELRLKPNPDGNPRTSINLQQFYNWYREKLMDNMWAEDAAEGGGFIGLQPVVKFKRRFKLIVPDVPRFTVHGTIVTEAPGEYPFLASSGTQIIVSHYSRPHAHAFLSHSSKDKTFVRELREKLYSICDTFFDETDIKPGQSITGRLNDALTRTDLLILLFSKFAAESAWVQKEWASMLHLTKPMVVVRLDETPIPPLLQDLKYISDVSSADVVADAISSALGSVDV
jgi:hypothetical protein